MNITKEKNLLKLSAEEGKVYTLNLTTGEWIGLRGATLKRIPHTIADAISWVSPTVLTTDHLNVVTCIHRAVNHWGRETGGSCLKEALSMLSLCERLDALHIEITVRARDLRTTWENNDWKYVADHFTDYCAFRQNHPNALDAYEFIRFYDKTKWMQDNKVPVEHLSPEFVEWLYDCAGVRNYDGTRAMEGNKLRWFLYHAKTLYDFMPVVGNRRDMALRWFNIYWDELTLIEAQPEKGNFMKLAAEVHKTYTVRKKELEERRLHDFQMEKQSALSFSANGLTVIIPTTKEEFAQEAAQQRNCVESMYLPRVCEGRTHVVFVRKDDNPTQSYITCEVSNSGRINQFYLRYNNYVYEEADCEFERLYQEHLNAHWYDTPTPTAE